VGQHAAGNGQETDRSGFSAVSIQVKTLTVFVFWKDFGFLRGVDEKLILWLV
jgi:hypothetical protein